MRQSVTELPDDDIVFVERRRDPRIIVSIAARYALANRRDASGDRREFACRIVDISLQSMTLLAPVKGSLGERVITHSDEFGRLEGTIQRLLDRGFVIQLSPNAEDRRKLTTKIEWYEKTRHHDASDKRAHKRITPKNPISTLVFPDGSVLGCFVLDISVSGAAVSADVQPPIGTPLAVGKFVGRVVRHMGDSFAVQFVELQNHEALEDGLQLT